MCKKNRCENVVHGPFVFREWKKKKKKNNRMKKYSILQLYFLFAGVLIDNISMLCVVHSVFSFFHIKNSSHALVASFSLFITSTKVELQFFCFEPCESVD